MKTQTNKLNKLSRVLQIIASIIITLISVTFISNPAEAANVHGTTSVVYIAPGQELPSDKTNTLSVENGVIAIILGDGSRVVVSGEEN